VDARAVGALVAGGALARDGVGGLAALALRRADRRRGQAVVDAAVAVVVDAVAGLGRRVGLRAGVEAADAGRRLRRVARARRRLGADRVGGVGVGLRQVGEAGVARADGAAALGVAAGEAAEVGAVRQRADVAGAASAAVVGIGVVARHLVGAVGPGGGERIVD